MDAPSRRLSPGERWRPTADALNGYQDAADYIHDLKAGGGALLSPGVFPQPTLSK